MGIENIQKAQDLAQEISVPPRPEVLIKVATEAKKENPRIDSIADALAEDASLSSAVLQVVNSPLYGLPRKITSIRQSVSLLGLPRIEKLVTVISMRNAVSGNLNLNRFWDSAGEIAVIASTLAQSLTGVNQDDAYTVGLFHDCGIPIMMQKFDDYKQVLKEAAQSNVLPRTKLEDERYGYNHAMVGYCLAQKWYLPDEIGKVVLFHHKDFEVFEAGCEDDHTTMSLLGILKMAEHISELFRKEMRDETDTEWNKVGEGVLDLIGLDEVDFVEICDDIIEKLATH